MYRLNILKDKNFEHLEMAAESANMPNPPVRNFGHPGLSEILREGQMYALAWMMHRVDYGGGILGDWVGGGKV
jgi:hypothetical protein